MPTRRLLTTANATERAYANKNLAKREREAIGAHSAPMMMRTLKAGERVAESEVKLAQLDRQERKLLTAHYDNKVSEELFGEEASADQERAF